MSAGSTLTEVVAAVAARAAPLCDAPPSASRNSKASLAAAPPTPALRGAARQQAAGPCLQYFPRGKHRLAYVKTPAAAPGGYGVFYASGLVTPMSGTKSVALESFIRSHLPAVSYVRFDYSSHGASSGSSFLGTHLGEWMDDALAIFDHVTDPHEKQIAVGSSMGGLVALHLALRRPDRVAALVLIAPAVGFADRRWARLSEEQRALLVAGGAVSLNTEYKEDQVDIQFYEVARKDFALPSEAASIPIHCPVRILHGARDNTVPLEISQSLATQIAGDDVCLTVVKDGAHTLTEPRDLELLQAAVSQLVAQLKREGSDTAATAAAAAAAAAASASSSSAAAAAAAAAAAGGGSNKASANGAAVAIAAAAAT